MPKGMAAAGSEITMKSIMHERDGTCYLCQRLNGNNYYHGILQEHHVFGGTANRKLSEQYGLKVYLCIYHHTSGPDAVHMNAENNKILKREAQEIFEKTHTREEFMKIFGRNWLEDKPVPEKKKETKSAAGFQLLPKEDALIGTGNKYLK